MYKQTKKLQKHQLKIKRLNKQQSQPKPQPVSFRKHFLLTQFFSLLTLANHFL